MSQQVTVHGPNIGQGGEFRVHRAGCADTKRGEYLVTEPPWSLNATSQQQVVEDIYSDIIPENPGSTWETYADTVRFYPCTSLATRGDGVTTLADVRRMFEPGSRWAVTNHYITREDHPAYGTTERTVTRTTSGKVYLAYADGSTVGIDWPKATQVAVVAETVTFSSHPRMPGEPFLTFRKVDSAPPTP